MAQTTSQELDDKLREQGFKRDEHDPKGQYHRPGEAGGVEKVWEKDGMIRTENNSTYQKAE